MTFDCKSLNSSISDHYQLTSRLLCLPIQQVSEPDRLRSSSGWRLKSALFHLQLRCRRHQQCRSRHKCCIWSPLDSWIQPGCCGSLGLPLQYKACPLASDVKCLTSQSQGSSHLWFGPLVLIKYIQFEMLLATSPLPLSTTCFSAVNTNYLTFKFLYHR